LNARKYVVTGAAGFIGDALARFLVEAGNDVVAVDRNPFDLPGARVVIADVGHAGALDGFTDRNTIVFHMAASADVPLSIRNPRHDFEDTFRGLFETLETARTTGCSVVFPSTASIYDPSNVLPLPERAFPRASSPYGAGKLAAESYCFAYHRSYDVDVRIARLFNVYGVGMRRFAIHDIVRRIQANPREITIRGDGNQIRDYLYIDDAVRGLAMISQSGAPGEDYNLASGNAVTIMELTRLIAKTMGIGELKVHTTGESFRGDTLRWYADVAKTSGLGFSPRVSLSAGLKRTVDWLTATPVRSVDSPSAN
jgi:nucleoside-diphosphate-sugar epimerase